MHLNFYTRSLITGVFLVILFTFAQLAYACSPAQTLTIMCESQWDYFYISDVQDIQDAIDSCQQLQPFTENLTILLMETNALEISATISTDNNPNFPRQKVVLDSYENMEDADCYAATIEKGNGWVLGYLEQQPYCVPEAALFCKSYGISPARKIAYDLHHNQLFSPLALLVSAFVGIFVGISLARIMPHIPISKKARHLIAHVRQHPKWFFVRILGLILLVLICGVGTFIPPVYNWLFLPSVPEFIFRIGFLFFGGSFFLTYVWSNRKQGKNVSST